MSTRDPNDARDVPDAWESQRAAVRPGATVKDAAGIERLATRAGTEFEQLFYGHDGRPINKWHHYLALYQRYFAPVRARAKARGEKVRFLEIGVWQGGSLRLWRRFFGPDAVIFGIDVDPAAAGKGDGEGVVRIGDQADTGFLSSVVDEMGGVDIVLDDGSHEGGDQIASFRTLFPLLSDTGVYACEDAMTAYHPDYDGGFRRPGTFIEFTKALIDDLHGWYSDAIEPAAPECALASAATGLHVHDGLIVVEKRPKRRPFKVLIDGSASRSD